MSDTGQLTATGAGAITFTATAAANSNYNQASTSTLIVIGKSTPTLSMLVISSMTVGLTQTAITSTTADVSSGGLVSYSITGSGSATINSANGLITALGFGTITITATSLGDTNYNSASTSTLINIGPSTPTLVFNSLSSTMVVGSTQIISATSTTALVDNGGGISYTVVAGTGSATINASTGLLTATSFGTIIVTATLLGDANYNQSSTSTLITIGKSTPTLILSVSNTLAVGLTQTAITSTTANMSSGGAVTFSITAIGSASATISSNGVITGVSVGMITLTATAAGDTNYYSTSASQAISVTIGTQSLTINNQPINLTVGSILPISVTTSVPSTLGGAITYSLAGGANSATIDVNGNLTAFHVGTLTLTVTALGNTNYYLPVSNTTLVTISKGTQILAFTSNGTMVVNSSMTASVTRTNVDGTSLFNNEGGPLTYSVTSTIGGGSATIDPNTGLVKTLSSGFVTLMVSAAGDSDYLPSQAMQSLAIFYAPGGVGVGDTDMLLWLRADNQVVTVGNEVSEWDDQSQSISMTVNQARTRLHQLP